MKQSCEKQRPGSIDQTEIDRFSAMAAEWWDPDGKFKPLHALNPSRIAYIREQTASRFNQLEGLSVLDIGCGGGLLCEPMARLGANVTGLDPSEKNIAIATTHADEQGLEINYVNAAAEDLAAKGEQFDLVLNMEVLEHVADIDIFLEACAKLIKPGGLMICATLNRTLKSFALAIVGAEYILRWLPAGTHQWERFVTPEELRDALERQNLEATDVAGVSYNPLSGEWSLSKDIAVNYLMTISA